jgi:serpin B
MSLRNLAILTGAVLSPAVVACSGTPGGSSPAQGASTLTQATSGLARDPASGISSDALNGAVAANNTFAIDLYAHLLAGQPNPNAGNMLIAPVSASLALTMTYAGAVGQTATEMAAALHFGDASASIFDGQNALSQALASRAARALQMAQQNASMTQMAAPSADDFALDVVNSVWGEQSYTWNTPFLDILAKSYGTGVYLEDFVHSFDAARVTINDWVATKTADKILNLLPPASVDDLTRIVLVNAIHLKLPWFTPFDASLTTTGTFTRSDATTVSAIFMNSANELSYADDGFAQLVDIPLEGNVSVIVALPDNDLPTYEANLTSGAASISTPLQDAIVTLSLPRFTFTSDSFSLATALQAMGMVQAFNLATADFTGMVTSPPDGERLHLEDVLQKTMIAVQETGVEAAAATAVVGSAGGYPPMPVTVNVNRPFVIAIIDDQTNAILFLGHIADPTASGGP